MENYGNMRIGDGQNKNYELRNNIKKSLEFELSLTPPFPSDMLLELSSICNHNCLFCANSKSNIKKIIDYDLAVRCLKEAYSLGVRRVGLYSRGEPLLDNNIFKYIEIAKDIGYEYVYITTNGALLTREIGRGLIDSGLDSIKVSVNAGTKEGYELIHGKDEFETVFNNIRELNKYICLAKSDCRVFISSVLCKYTVEDESLIRDKFGPFVDEIEFFDVVNQGGTMPENEMLYVDNTINNGTGGVMCPMPFNRLCVTVEGLIDACCVDYYNYLVVGDLSQNTMSEIWSSERFWKVREMLTKGRLEKLLCGNCMTCRVQRVNPIMEEYAVEKDIYAFSKKDEMKKRIDRFLNYDKR